MPADPRFYCVTYFLSPGEPASRSCPSCWLHDTCSLHRSNLRLPSELSPGKHTNQLPRRRQFLTHINKVESIDRVCRMQYLFLSNKAVPVPIEMYFLEEYNISHGKISITNKGLNTLNWPGSNSMKFMCMKQTALNHTEQNYCQCGHPRRGHALSGIPL